MKYVISLLLTALIGVEGDIWGAISSKVDFGFIAHDIASSEGFQSLHTALGKPENEDLERIQQYMIVSAVKSVVDAYKKMLWSAQQLQNKTAQHLKLVVEDAKKDKHRKLTANRFILKAQESDSTVNLSSITLQHALTDPAVIQLHSLQSYSSSMYYSDILNMIQDGLKIFKDWASKIYKKVLDVLKPIAIQIKDLAVAFLKQNWDTITKPMCAEAIDFFMKHAPELGAKLLDELNVLAREKGLTGKVV